MKKLLLVLFILFPVLIVWAAPKPATEFVIQRATLNDDGSAYTDQAGLRFQCGQTKGGPYIVTSDVPESQLPVAAGVSVHQLSAVLGSQTDGAWYCVVKETNAKGMISPASNESERIAKAGTSFFVDRPGPDAPGSLLVR